MPTKKPVIQVVLEQDIYDKLQILCKAEERTASKKGGMIIRDYIENYEKQNGTISINTGDITMGDNNNINIR